MSRHRTLRTPNSPRGTSPQDRRSSFSLRQAFLLAVFVALRSLCDRHLHVLGSTFRLFGGSCAIRVAEQKILLVQTQGRLAEKPVMRGVVSKAACLRMLASSGSGAKSAVSRHADTNNSVVPTLVQAAKYHNNASQLLNAKEDEV